MTASFFPSLGAGGPQGRRLAGRSLLASPLVLARSQSGARSLALGGDGVTWAEYAADAGRPHGTAQRPLLEGARTNLVENPRFEGAAPGTPGTAPGNWTVFTSTAAGVTRQIVGTGLVDGLPYIDVRYFGTPTGTTGSSLVSPSSTVAVGSRHIASGWLALVAGSTANLAAPILRVAAETGTTFAWSGSLARVVCKRTLTGTTANWTLRLGYVNTTDAVDYTIRVAAPQLELVPGSAGGEPSSPILPVIGTPAAAARGADLATAAIAGLFPDGAGTLLWSGLAQQDTAGGVDQVLAQIDDGSDANAFRLRNLAGGTSLVAGRVLAGSAADATALGSLGLGSVFRVGLTFTAAGRVAACLGGGSVQVATGGPTSGLTVLRLGNNAAGTAPLFGELGDCRTLPFAIPDSALPSLLATLTP